MNNETIQKLANLAVIKNHISNDILNMGRGIIPKQKLHQLQAEGTKIDLLFIDILLSDSKTGENDQDINKRIAEEKAKMNNRTNAHVSVEEATSAAIQSTAKAPVKKSPAKKKTRAKKSKKDSVVVVNAPQ